MRRQKFIGDYPDNARLLAVLLPDPNRAKWAGWNEKQREWLKAHVGKPISGRVVWEDETLYLRPDGVPKSGDASLVLCDDEIRITSPSPVYAKKLENRDVQICSDYDCKKKLALFPSHYSNKPTKRNKTITLNCAEFHLVWPE